MTTNRTFQDFRSYLERLARSSATGDGATALDAVEGYSEKSKVLLGDLIFEEVYKGRLTVPQAWNRALQLVLVSSSKRTVR